MKKEMKHNQKFTYYQSKKIHGGVGAKKQSIYKTPIRLTSILKTGDSDFSGNSTQIDTSNLKPSHINLNDEERKALRSHINFKERQSVMRPDLVTSMMIDLSTPSTNMRRESAKITKEEVIIINHKSNGFNCCLNKHKPTSKQNQLKFNKSCDLKLDVYQRENDAKVITDQNESRRQSKIGFKPLPKTVIENSDTSRQTSVSRKIKTKCLTELKGNIPDSSI